ncbi:hypothetical protein [Psychroserpens burtonensis]|uniref:hypothetical protein n=1 Tax=Psychroserpens burtonensis TaxID=49278 RepID=UPI0012FA2412|nr:hypothetical protein [Psychroserpens burtonensis]
MNKQDNSPNIRQGKDSNKRTQLQTIFTYLRNHIATASMVTDATGVPQKCITRYKRDLEELGLLTEVKYCYCEKTKHLAWYLTTNPKHFPPSNQLKMF